jgi:hypothetical protein
VIGDDQPAGRIPPGRIAQASLQCIQRRLPQMGFTAFHHDVAFGGMHRPDAALHARQHHAPRRQIKAHLITP